MNEIYTQILSVLHRTVDTKFIIHDSEPYTSHYVSYNRFIKAEALITGVAGVVRCANVHRGESAEIESSVSRRPAGPVREPLSFILSMHLLPELHSITVSLLNCFTICRLS